MTTKIWSYTCINWDLIRDDLDSAVDIFPVRYYKTREKAIENLVKDLNAYWHSYEDHEKVIASDMKWEESARSSDDGSLLCSEFYHEQSEDTYFLYEMELID